MSYDPPRMAELYFGGTFNPIHNAHLHCSTAAAGAGGFDGVVLVPTGQSALKSAADLASAKDRLAMARIAATEWAGPIRVRVEPMEVERPGVSYTIDTALTLKAAGVEQIHWLIGTDQLLNLHRWHRYHELLTLVQFWVMARPGYVIDWNAIDPAARRLWDHVLRAPLVDISGTMIRQQLHRGYAVDQWVSPGVSAYIREHSLYIPTLEPVNG
jgi:nicotinate-nucleotide adenylyltransferase